MITVLFFNSVLYPKIKDFIYSVNSEYDISCIYEKLFRIRQSIAPVTSAFIV